MVQFVVNVLDLAAQTVPIKTTRSVFPINAIYFAGNMPNFATRPPIGPISSHPSLNMREHAVNMVDLGACLVVPA